MILHIKQTYSSKGKICFSSVATSDINIVYLRETDQLLLKYILSRHFRLTPIRLSPDATHTNKWTSYIDYPAASHWINVFLTSVYTKTYSYDTVYILILSHDTESSATTIFNWARWHYTVLRTHCLRNVIIISYLVHHKLFELYYHTSQVDYLGVLGMIVPNRSMPLTLYWPVLLSGNIHL
jgi:hypothetical protein